MTSDEAHALAGEYGLELRFDHAGQSWALGLPGRGISDECVWITPHVLSGLTPSRFVRHYVQEVLGRAGGPDSADED